MLKNWGGFLRLFFGGVLGPGGLHFKGFGMVIFSGKTWCWAGLGVLGNATHLIMMDFGRIEYSVVKVLAQ